MSERYKIVLWTILRSGALEIIKSLKKEMTSSKKKMGAWRSAYQSAAESGTQVGGDGLRNLEATTFTQTGGRAAEKNSDDPRGSEDHGITFVVVDVFPNKQYCSHI